MAQNVLPFRYEEEKTTSGMMALAGLPLFLELFYGMGLNRDITAKTVILLVARYPPPADALRVTRLNPQ